MLFWSWPCGLFSLWSGPRQKKIFLMGINKPFINILCCAHLPVCHTAISLLLFISSIFFSQAHYFWYPYSFLLLPSSTFFLIFLHYFYGQARHVQPPTNLTLRIQLLQRERKGQQRRSECLNICVLVLTQQVFPHVSLPISLSDTRPITTAGPFPR